MSFDLLNFLPGWKRPITVLLGVVLVAWHTLFTNEVIGFDVPSYVYMVAGLFGYNAIAQAPKNDAAK